MKVTANWLSEVTGKHHRTILKHLGALERDKSGRYDSAEALLTLYLGNGSGPTYSEAIRRLAIAREAVEREREVKMKIENDLTLKRVIPAERVLELLENIFLAIRSKIVSSHLSEAEQNAILNDLVALRDADL
jgi:hypothetical protein